MTFAPRKNRDRAPAAPMQPIVDPAGWTKAELAANDDWIFRLSDADRAEIADAVEGVEARGLDIKDIGRDDFALPRLGEGLAAVRDELVNGRGFVLIRGLPVGDLTRRQSAIAYWGLSTHFGRAVSQNGKGHLLGHVKDVGGDYSRGDTRGYLTRAQLGFHVDRCDHVGLLCLQPAMKGGESRIASAVTLHNEILARRPVDRCDHVVLLCLQPAMKGGESRIASAVTLHNEILARRPDLMAELVKDFYWSWIGEAPPGSEPWYLMPVFSFEDGYLCVRGVSSHIYKSRQLPGVPPFTDKQVEALDFFKEVVNEIAFDMAFDQGDIQILHNPVTLHSRRGFEDWPEPARKRHLLRLWIRDDGCRPIPAVYRGIISGIHVRDGALSTPLDVGEAA
jgi:hypothetical protein